MDWIKKLYHFFECELDNAELLNEVINHCENTKLVPILLKYPIDFNIRKIRKTFAEINFQY